MKQRHKTPKETMKLELDFGNFFPYVKGTLALKRKIIK